MVQSVSMMEVSLGMLLLVGDSAAIMEMPRKELILHIKVGETEVQVVTLGDSFDREEGKINFYLPKDKIHYFSAVTTVCLN